MVKKKTNNHNPASTLKERFHGSEGRRLLLEALLNQKIVGANSALAAEIAALGELIAVSEGAALVEQEGADNDVYLVIAGALDIIINDKPIARRYPSDHIGEIAAVLPAQTRSAAVVAIENSVLLKLTEPQLSALGMKYPEIYRSIAKELALRLLQRNTIAATRRERARIFILSSAEALDLANTIRKAFEHDPYDVVIWTDGVFRASNYSIEILEHELDRSDFAIAIAPAVDPVKTRGKGKASPRDKVIFELGLFIGRLGRHRSILLEPREMKLPSGRIGVTTILYTHASGKNLPAALGPACKKMRAIINEIGPNN